MMKAGFTLIELLVAVTIMLLIVGGGIVAYLRFNDRQVVSTSARELQTYLRSAQTKARAAERPDSCSKLQGYSVGMAAGASTVSLTAVCDSGNEAVATYQLNPSVTSESTFAMRFRVLHGGVANPATVTLTDGELLYQFEVNQGGEITIGDFIER